jgi:hypothetical protein
VRKSRTWGSETTVKLKNAWPIYQPAGSVARAEAILWNEYALALILPRHFPEYVSDEDISATIRHVAATERLPWK